MNNLVAHAPGTAVFQPRNLSEQLELSRILADSELVPKDFRGRPGNVFAALAWGAELGLGPMQALSGIAVVNGRAAIWGDTLLALCQRHPAFEGMTEGVEGAGDAMEGWCEVRRRGRDPVRRTFDVPDARRAKLWDKEGPWRQYPQRMLMLRARGWALRDQFADALRGIYSVEEAQDIPPEPRQVPNLAEPPLPPPTHAVRAAPGSLAEHAAGLTGREVEHPEPPAPEEGLPLVTLDGELREVARGRATGAPALVVWRAAALREVARVESRAALRGWRLTNGPHFGAVAALSPEHAEAVREVEGALEARLEQFDGDADAE